MSKEDVLFKHSGKRKQEDIEYVRNMDGEELENIVFTRSIARKVHFFRVKFNFCFFDNCYFRDCVFDSCEFTGCKFIGSNFNGSTFQRCNFRYAIFERTVLDFESVMESLPAEENLRAKLLRTLRVNFQQQGDAASVNKVISLELAATQIHLKKSWLCGGEYYRKKYRDFDRVKKFGEWALFRFLDFVWGNGESVAKLFRTTLLLMLAISFREFWYSTDKNNLSTVIDCIIKSPSIFFGVIKDDTYEEYTRTAIYFLRLVVFGLFMSIVIKRISRR